MTNENYSTLADGAKYENVTFPFTITGLDNDKTYYIAVYQVCGGAETQVGSEVSVTPLSAPTSGGSSGITPEPVNVTRVDAGVESVTVQWNGPSDFSKTSADYPTVGYTVCYQAGSSIGNGATCVEDVWRGQNSYTFRGLKGGVQHCFGVKQWKEEIGLSPFGATRCTTPTEGAPTGVTATPGDTQVTVNWTAVSGATSYNVYYSTTTGVNTSNGTLVTGATSGSAITGLTNGTTYYFVVTAVNANGESAESSEVSAMPAVQGGELLTNGSFETGDFTGWTAETNGSASDIWAVLQNGEGYPGGDGIVGPAPSAGVESALATQPQGPSTLALWQNVSIPAGATNVTLTFDWAVTWFGEPSANDKIRVDVTTQAATALTEASGILQNIFTHAGDGGDFAVWQNSTTDLSAYAGQNIRIRFWVDAVTAPSIYFLDNVSLSY